ncbi:hypothetical protein F444_06304 [Phytophthora nicotianae P1976]|uniref:Uncharacterized protein n=1 Tax=Phytophthora nicotianae P1976 TaxID=1317066 RepID=A0A081AJ08_PHYNI|nr:hypothetical protein F444_06304 [Phytophthora nicotianae P1976]
MEPRRSTLSAYSSSTPVPAPDEPVEESVQLMFTASTADVPTGLTTRPIESASSPLFKRRPIKPPSASEVHLQAIPFNAQSVPTGATLPETSACTQPNPSIVLAPLSSGVGSTESPILESPIAPVPIKPTTDATVPTNYQLKPPPEEEYSSEADAEAAIHA